MRRKQIIKQECPASTRPSTTDPPKQQQPQEADTTAPRVPKITESLARDQITASQARQARQQQSLVVQRALVYETSADGKDKESSKITPILETSSPSSPVLARCEDTMGDGGGNRTGAVQKKRSYRSQHSNSLKHSGSGNDVSNLVAMRNSNLGKSAPSLSVTMKESFIQAKRSSVVHQQQHHQPQPFHQQQMRSPAVHRVSLISSISPRSHSPISASPIDSPRGVYSPNTSQFSFPYKRAASLSSKTDIRRWSVAALPSPGYGTTPSSSNISSQCSSQERLHQFPFAPTHDEIRTLTHHFSGNEPTVDNHPLAAAQLHPTACGTQLTYPTKQPNANHPLAFGSHLISTSSSSSSSSPHHLSRKQQLNLMQHEQQKHLHQRQQATAQQPNLSLNMVHQHDGNNNNNSTTEDNSSGGSAASGGGFFVRPRSRSLSSTVRSPIVDNELPQMNQLYKERFPKATKQMEERLAHLIRDYEDTLRNQKDPQPVVRFVYNQVMEMAKDCLHKSQAKLITSSHFLKMYEKLERLIIDSSDKAPLDTLDAITKRLIFIIARPALLLECLEFNPQDFYTMLEQAEDQAKNSYGITTDIPQYIVRKLGLNTDPLTDLQLLDDNSNPCTVPTADSSLNDSLEHDMSMLMLKDNSRITSTPKKRLCASSNPLQRSNSSLDAQRNDSARNSSLGANEMLHQSSSSLSGAEATMNVMRGTSAESSANATDDGLTAARQPGEEDFKEIKLISNGAYGSVHLVKHIVTGNRYALKRMNKNYLMLRNQVDQVFTERDILSFADNPFVVSMICSFETKRHLCLVMEYVEGGDCAAMLKKVTCFPETLARFYFAETVLAVEYLHSYGIVHRDLKPDNLLITAFGHIKLTDFGLSKMGLMSLATNMYEEYIENDDDQTNQFSDKQVYGTPEYIAPEVILRKGYGKPVDWWSMGIILYQFIIGCVPFFGETPEELFAHTVNDDIEWPDDSDMEIQPDAKQIITMLLQQNPRNRLGAGGSNEVKDHPYFKDLDWNSLLRKKVEFVPELEGDDDTSYFDTRLDRYNHEFADDTDDTDDTPVFGSFNSSSMQYRKISSSLASNDLDDVNSSNSSINEAGRPSPADFSRLNINPGKMKMPSTPDADFLPELNSPDRLTSPAYYGRHHSLKFPSALCDSPDLQSPSSSSQHHSSMFKLHHAKQMRSLNVNTPDSSQTDSDDVSPKVTRRKKMFEDVGKGREGAAALPRLSVSMEHEYGASAAANPPTTAFVALPTKKLSLDTTAASSHHRPTATDLDPNTMKRSPQVIKSASAANLSLMVSSPMSEKPSTSPLAAQQQKQPSKVQPSCGSLASNLKFKPKLSSDGTILNRPPSFTTSFVMGGPSSSSSQPQLHSPCKPIFDVEYRSSGGGGGSSTASSRDTSPCRELTPLINNLRPPVMLKRGARGVGFSICTIRVFLGDTDYFTYHHRITSVDKGSSAYEAGLRPGDILTHINGETVVGLVHTQVLQLLLGGKDLLSLRATPICETSIKSGGRKREPGQTKLAKRTNFRPKNKKNACEKKRKPSLFRKISKKAEIQQLASSGLQSPTMVPSSRSFQSFARAQDRLVQVAGGGAAAAAGTSGTAINRLSLSPLDPFFQQISNSNQSASNSSQSSSPSSSVPNTPTANYNSSFGTAASVPTYQRPSSLHGLKHKLHTIGKNVLPQLSSGGSSSNRRKSVCHIPLSPLARTPSPSPCPSSPTRSPSPLAYPAGHQPGSSNTTQSYSPNVMAPVSGAGKLLLGTAKIKAKSRTNPATFQPFLLTTTIPQPSSSGQTQSQQQPPHPLAKDNNQPKVHHALGAVQKQQSLDAQQQPKDLVVLPHILQAKSMSLDKPTTTAAAMTKVETPPKDSSNNSEAKDSEKSKERDKTMPKESSSSDKAAKTTVAPKEKEQRDKEPPKDKPKEKPTKPKDSKEVAAKVATVVTAPSKQPTPGTSKQH